MEGKAVKHIDKCRIESANSNWKTNIHSVLKVSN